MRHVLRPFLALVLLSASVRASAQGGWFADPNDVIIPELKALVLVQDPAEVVKGGLMDTRGVKVQGVELLDTDDFKKQLGKRLGKPVTRRGRVDILNEIAVYCRSHGRPFVDVSTLPQDVTDGVLQVLVLQAKVGSVRVFGGDEQLASQFTAKQGSPVDANALAADLDWINRNPFRQVDLVYAKGTEFGSANILLKETKRFPLRGFVGYDDTGTRMTQHERLSAGLDFGGLPGSGVLSYQFLTSPDFKSFRAHSGSWMQPLPWRHMLTIFGSYADIRANLPPPFDLGGYNWQTSIRYEVPLPGTRDYKHALTAGFDYKQSNNNLTFGGISVFRTATDVAQWSLNYGARLKDPFGETSLRLTGTAAPGGVTPASNTGAYRLSRAYSRANYAYVKAELNRTTPLPYGFTLVSLLSGQMADANLLASEQLGLGGHDSVRGYDTRVYNADNGYAVSMELRTPSAPLLSLWPRLERLGDRVQFLAFTDYGAGSNHLRLPGERNEVKLWSAGPGLRYTISSHVTFRADYGWQLLNQAESGRRYTARSHIGLVARY